MRIPISVPYFGAEESEAVTKPLESGWVVQGPYVAEFERKFGEYTEIPHNAAASSCTTALHLAVAALGLGAGDEVVVPAFTWVSTANVVEYTGATPRFCDIDLTTFNAPPEAIDAATGERTVGLLPVHLFGLCAEMGPIMEHARRRGLWVVEDAACALGAWYEGKHAGSFGDAGCFSFHPRKSITTGEGGMVSTLDPELDRRVRSLRDHGASRSDHDRHDAANAFLLSSYDSVGFNYRMTDIQAAVGCVQMDRARWILDRRRELAGRYDELLADLKWLRRPVTPPGHVHGYQAYVCLFCPDEPTLANLASLHERRNALMRRAEEEGVATRQGTHAAALTGVYSQKYGLRAEEFPNAAIAEGLTLALPLYPQLTDADQERVVDVIRAAYVAA